MRDHMGVLCAGGAQGGWWGSPEACLGLSAHLCLSSPRQDQSPPGPLPTLPRACSPGWALKVGVFAVTPFTPGTWGVGVVQRVRGL